MRLIKMFKMVSVTSLIAVLIIYVLTNAIVIPDFLLHSEAFRGQYIQNICRYTFCYRIYRIKLILSQ